MKNIFKLLILTAVLLLHQGALYAQEPPVSESYEHGRIEIIYKESRTKIDALDPKKQENESNYYPGLRGPNQLVIYTPEYGIRTGTNEYGTEAVVTDGMVTSLNGADSIIPYNGFVISGHGRAKNWIMKNIQIGAKVYIDYENNVLNCYITPESLIFAAKEKIKEVNALLEYYREMDILYNDKKAAAHLETSKELVRRAEMRPEKTQSLINEAMVSIDEALKNAIPYFQSELKGVWIRPVEDTPEKIEKSIAKMHNAGITDIFLETFFHGSVIYDSRFLRENGVISQLEEFKGFDPLEVWIKEAHKRNMKVHIWFECFYLGNDKPQDVPNHILSIYPEWSNKRLSNYTSKEPVFSVSEHNGYFLDPANTQVQAFLLGILNEIITNYHPDGINLDYIRYPQSADTSYTSYALTNWGYTETAREQFKLLSGVDPVDIKYGTKLWDLWSAFRQDKITDFVKSVKQISEPHEILVTAVIFPDLKKSETMKMQNWQLWAAKNYADGFTPLILTCDKNTAVKLLQDIQQYLGGSAKIYPGLFASFMGASSEDLLMLIQKSREFQSGGIVLFDYAHLENRHTDALKARVYNSSYDARPIRNSMFFDSALDNQQLQKTKKQNKKDKRKKRVKRRKHWLFG